MGLKLRWLQWAMMLKRLRGGRLADWDREKRRASVALSRELDELRKERLDRLNEDLAKERDNARLAEERRQAEESRRMEREALDIGAAFAARLLGALACPELESRLDEILSGTDNQ